MAIAGHSPSRWGVAPPRVDVVGEDGSYWSDLDVRVGLDPDTGSAWARVSRSIVIRRSLCSA